MTGTISRTMVLIAVVGSGILSMASAADPIVDVVSKPDNSFVVLDGTLYQHKPDMAQYGITRVNIIYANKFWRDMKKADGLPAKEVVQDLARAAAGSGPITILDIEHWPLREELAAKQSSSVRDSLDKYTTVLRWFREVSPGLRLGYYGTPPIRDYYRTLEGASPAFLQWQEENDRIMSLVNELDILLPSAYAFYPDYKNWVRYATAQIKEARRCGNGKPVYVFLWPQYHESNRSLGLKFLPPEFWRLQLQTAREHADGIVLWGGWDSDHNKPAEWDNEASWWKVTKEFLATLDRKSLNPSADSSAR